MPADTERFWHRYARCDDPAAFFDDIWPDDLDTPRCVNVDALQRARSECAQCPVRRSCLTAAMQEERGEPVSQRFGLRAYLTPGQRRAVEQRRIQTCPGCGTTRDPVDLESGLLRCPARCGYPDDHTPGLALIGDQWTRRHTLLSRRIVAHIVENVDIGGVVPNPHRMALILDTRKADVVRVYGALMDDGTITKDGPARNPTYTRIGSRGAMKSWRPPYLR